MVQSKRRRYTGSDAYVDSTLIVAFLIGLIVFAVWIAYETASVINPWWLGGSIIAVGIYEMVIFWCMRQYWNTHRIFTIFFINIVSLGLVLGLTGLVFDIRLPVDLPVLSAFIYFARIEATSFSPGAVALSYSVIGLLTGYVVVGLVALVENTPPVLKMKKWLKLDQLDLLIDAKLDESSVFLEEHSFFWVLVPIVLLVVLNVLVVGTVALL